MNEESKTGIAIFCWVAFLITFFAGLGMFLAPGKISDLAGIPAAAAEFNPYFIKLLGLILVAVSLCYFMAIYDDDAARSLIFIASGEKVLAVLYTLAALVSGRVGKMTAGVILTDGLLAIIGFYFVFRLSRTLWTDDDMDEKK